MSLKIQYILLILGLAQLILKVSVKTPQHYSKDTMNDIPDILLNSRIGGSFAVGDVGMTFTSGHHVRLCTVRDVLRHVAVQARWNIFQLKCWFITTGPIYCISFLLTLQAEKHAFVVT